MTSMTCGMMGHRKKTGRLYNIQQRIIISFLKKVGACLSFRLYSLNQPVGYCNQRVAGIIEHLHIV